MRCTRFLSANVYSVEPKTKGSQYGLIRDELFWRLAPTQARRRSITISDCKFYLEALFDRKVDLVMKGAIKKRLKPYILGEVVYA